MNREIKFRGYATGIGWVYGSLVNNIWTYSEYSDQKKGSPVFEIITGEYDGDCWSDIAEQDGESIIKVVPESVGQFTGLKDKNGKEIYEGDILTSSEYPYQDNGNYNYHAIVEWVYSSWQIVLKCVNKNKNGISDGINHQLEYEDNELLPFEIMGNIYSNPELLK